MPPRLVALTEGPDLLLDKPILLVGRHQECDIQLGSRKISRRHCCIAQINNHLIIRDLCSTNGIRVNGVRVAEGQLKPGDELTIGNYNYRLQWEDQPVGRRAPAPGEEKAAPALEPPRVTGGDPLLSCEIPVPLGEPGVLPLPAGWQAMPRKGDRSNPPPEPAPPLIVPDDLSLAPLSDDVVPGSGPKPPAPAS
jgi:predicted component of type VI protein secretion system